MKKILALILAMLMVLSMAACGVTQGSGQRTENNQSNKSEENIGTENDISAVKTVEELEELILKDVEVTIEDLNSEWEKLSSQVGTYDEYVKKAEDVKSFYEKINSQTELACIRLQNYAIAYAEMILESDMSTDDMYDAFDDLYDCIYEDATDDLKDGIYDDLLDSMKETIYDGALDDSDDADSYSDWYEIRSEEYEHWYDTRSDVYENWYDSRSDIYEFWYDMRSELWDDDIEKAQEILADYKADIAELLS